MGEKRVDCDDGATMLEVGKWEQKNNLAEFISLDLVLLVLS